MKVLSMCSLNAIEKLMCNLELEAQGDLDVGDATGLCASRSESDAFIKTLDNH